MTSLSKKGASIGGFFNKLFKDKICFPACIYLLSRKEIFQAVHGL